MKLIVPRPEENLDDEVISLVGANPARRPEKTDYGFMLVVFMRVVAGLWMLRGLMHWRTILAYDTTPFEALPLGIAACVIFFSVADILAAVGMWLASGWGGVLWIFATAANIIVTMVMPDFHTGGRLMLAIDFALIALYFVLTWYAAHMREE